MNERIIMAQFSGQPRNITVIHAYAPTTDAKDETIEEFYTKLNELIKETSRKDVIIITGDWNAKVEEDREGWEEVMASMDLESAMQGERDFWSLQQTINW